MPASGAATVLLLVREMALGRTESGGSEYWMPKFLMVEFIRSIGVPNVKGCLLPMSKFPFQEQAVSLTENNRVFVLKSFFQVYLRPAVCRRYPTWHLPVSRPTRLISNRSVLYSYHLSDKIGGCRCPQSCIRLPGGNDLVLEAVGPRSTKGEVYCTAMEEPSSEDVRILRPAHPFVRLNEGTIGCKKSNLYLMIQLSSHLTG
jgi:hypothetical protein